MNKPPFFIIGCVRSGTTLLRDVLRQCPNLAAPEETHFFTSSHPFGCAASFKILLDDVILQKHRALDGISEAEFSEMLRQSVSRASLQRRYMALFISRNKPEAKRWFDKTPQNVYGFTMIATEFPAAKFIHCVRHPIEVIASLRIGKVVKIDSLIGACNFWNEAAEMVYVLKRAYPQRVYELRYEDFTNNMLAETEKILDFIDEPFELGNFSAMNARINKPSQHDLNGLFTKQELKTISVLCQRWADCYGYSFGETPKQTKRPGLEAENGLMIKQAPL